MEPLKNQHTNQAAKPVSQLPPASYDITQNELSQRLSEAYPNVAYPNPVWSSIENNARFTTISAGHLLMKPDSVCLYFLMPVAGCIRVYQQTPNDREVTLYRVYAGEMCVLSIDSLIKNKSFDAFSMVETDLTALVLDRPQFIQAMAVYSPFRDMIMTNITGRFREMLQLVEKSVFESLDSRILFLLESFSQKNSTDTIELTHQDIARELGSSREVVSRVLKGLERQGVISLGRGSVKLNAQI